MEDTKWKVEPLLCIDGMFEDSTTSNLSSHVTSFFSSKVTAVEGRTDSLPAVCPSSIESIPGGHLVYFRGMIQDMFDPELFVDKYRVLDTASGVETTKCGRYRNASDLKENETVVEDSVAFCQRQAYYVVPVPGQSTWVKDMNKVLQGKFCSYEKLPRLAGKRTADDAMEVEEDEAGVANKRAKGDEGDVNDKSSSTKTPVDYSKNFPFANEEGTACLVQVYDKPDSLKLLELVEVIGIYEPPVGRATHSDDDITPVRTMLTSQVPVIHAVLVNKLPHINPLLPRNVFDQSSVDQTLGSSLAETRDLLFAMLVEVFLGDVVAAEYSLLHMISCVTTRDLGVTSHLPLNLFGFPSDLRCGVSLSRLLTYLSTHCCKVDLSLASLHSLQFMPIKDHNSGQLKAGLLQLPAKTELIVDETSMTIGQLESRAVLNLRALTGVVQEQTLTYDFQFYTHAYPVDIRVLVLSEGRSIVKGCMEMAWRPIDMVNDSSSVSDAMEQASASLITRLEEDNSGTSDRVRQYLSVVPFRRSDYSIPEDVQEKINEDFVRLRKGGEHHLTVEEFAAMLTLLQLLTVSYGKTRAEHSHWQTILRLEEERKKRMSKP